MKRAALALLFAAVVLFAGGCCGTDRCRAVVAANLMHDAGDAAALALADGCTARYKAAQSRDEIAALDKPCIPAAEAYGSFRKALAVLVTKLAAGETTVGAVLAAAQEAASQLGEALAEVRP